MPRARNMIFSTFFLITFWALAQIFNLKPSIDELIVLSFIATMILSNGPIGAFKVTAEFLREMAKSFTDSTDLH